MSQTAPEPFDLTDFLPYRLAVAAARVSRSFAERYRAEFGISVAEWRVLAHLSHSGHVSVREICARVDMDKPRVSRAAARLESAGFISKRGNADDRRLVDLALTRDGQALMAALVPMAERFQSDMIARLGSDAPALCRALDRLTAEAET